MRAVRYFVGWDLPWVGRLASWAGLAATGAAIFHNVNGGF